jgi:anti-sigma factor RsiW
MSEGDKPDGAGEAHPEVEARFDELAEGALAPADADELRAHLAGCAACRAAYDEHAATLAALSGLGKHKVAAPPGLPGSVEQTIHRRSGGRFFGRRAFGDRVPFEVLALIALAIVVVIFLILRGSPTGSLRLEQDPGSPPAEGVDKVIPRP